MTASEPTKTIAATTAAAIKEAEELNAPTDGTTQSPGLKAEAKVDSKGLPPHQTVENDSTSQSSATKENVSDQPTSDNNIKIDGFAGTGATAKMTQSVPPPVNTSAPRGKNAPASTAGSGSTTTTATTRSPGFASPNSGGRWSNEEDATLRQAVDEIGARNWKRISMLYFNGSRTDVQCLHRWQKVLRPGLVKGPWTPEEDQIVIRCMQERIVRWSEIAAQIPGRIGKQCRERWFNHLDPDIQKGGWTEAEDRLLVEAQARFGNRWSRIAKLIPGRAENAVKNRWNSSMRRKATAAAAGTPNGKKSGTPKGRKKKSVETLEEREAKIAEKEAKKAEREAKKAKKAAAAAAKKAKAAKEKAAKKKNGTKTRKKRGSKRRRNDETSEAEEAANVMTFLASGLTNMSKKNRVMADQAAASGPVDRDIKTASLNLANMLASISGQNPAAAQQGDAKKSTLANTAAAVAMNMPVGFANTVPMTQASNASNPALAHVVGMAMTQPPSLPVRVPLPSGGITSPTANPADTSSADTEHTKRMTEAPKAANAAEETQA